MWTIILAIRLAWHKGWRQLSLESDSAYAVHLFWCGCSKVPWSLRNAWVEALEKAKSLSFVISHSFREANTVADCLANYGIVSCCYT